MTMKLRRKTLITAIVLILLCFCSCSEKKVSSQRYCFGTLCTVTSYSKCSQEVFDGLWEKMADLENRISCKLEYSTVSAMNRGEKTAEDEDIEKLLETGIMFCSLTGGAFSPYIGKVTELWAIGTENAKVPSQEEITKALGQKSLDFGAMGKGYAADVAAKYLKEHGVESAIINFGGDICCVGSKGKKGFTIGIQNPDSERGTYIQTVEVSDCCVVTSGNYERYFEENSVRYCHIFNALTGYPVQGKLKSVTVIGPEGLICDALATCCYILGEEESSILLGQFEDYSVLFL